MKVLILGAGGMVGQKLVKQILQTGFNSINPSDIHLFDLDFPNQNPTGVNLIKGDLGDPEQIKKLATCRFDIIFHLAAIVSGEAEENFDRGWKVNLFSMWHLLENLKVEHLNSSPKYIPRIIFTSSIAVFGAPYPDKIDDEFLCAPQTSYGAQKASAELLLSDFSRKGFVNGISLRLPTICVRPGSANKAASSFFSSIIREPLNNKTAYLPVDTKVKHWHASPRAAANFLLHATTIDTSILDNRRSLNLPGVSCTVEEQIEALRKIAGQKVVDLIISKPDPFIKQMVSGWPSDFEPERALKVGFKAETNFEQIISTYISDDLEKA
jgi:nucleoside-diphosphate-sugar epimerase